LPDTTGVRVERDGPVTVVTIDRPGRRNAVDPVAAAALAEAFREVERDPATSVAVLTGAGGAFCAGADLKAAVEGPAVAGGLELALWCDLRVAAEGATFGVLNRRFGVPLIDLGTIRLPRIVGHGRAMDLLLTGRVVGAAEALAMGLANRVVPDGAALEAAVGLARELAALPQAGLRNDRLSAVEQWDLPEHEAIANELRRGMATIASGETAAGAAGFAAGQGRHGAALPRHREPETR
jgi:enoyl-CoA hydratase